MGLTNAISIVNWTLLFFLFLNRKLFSFFLLFFSDFKLLMFHNNIVKIPEILNKTELVEILPQVHILPYHFLYILQTFLPSEK